MSFDKAELETFRQLIFENLVEGVIKLVEAMDELNIRLQPNAFVSFCPLLSLSKYRILPSSGPGPPSTESLTLLRSAFNR